VSYSSDVDEILDMIDEIKAGEEDIDYDLLRRKLKDLGREADSDIYELGNEKTHAKEQLEALEEKLAAFERKFEAAVEILRANGIDVSEDDVDLASWHARPAEFLRKLGVIQTVQKAAERGQLRGHASCSPGFCHDWYVGLTPDPCAVSGLTGRGRYRP